MAQHRHGTSVTIRILRAIRRLFAHPDPHGYKPCPGCGRNDDLFEGPEGGAFIHVRCPRCETWHLG